MSALEEQRSYGLSSGKLSCNVSVFHVKLTDSAARAISTFQNAKGWFSQPTICFNGNQGRIKIPCSKERDEARIFTFGVTNVARDNPHGSFDCVQQLSTRAADELSCLGVIQKKMTVKATDDSYDKALQSMAQVEEETRSRGAIVIKHGGRFQGKRVTVRAPAPANLTKPRHATQMPKPTLAGSVKKGRGSGFEPLPGNVKKGVCVSRLKKGACASSRRSVSDVQDRPLGERVTHLLALRPYKRPELILRLQKDGLTAGDKDLLNSVLLEVGQLNTRDNTFVLKDGLYKEVQKDWPGYTSGDQQLLKRILVRRLFSPQQNLLSVPEAQVSPLRDTPNSSPAHRPKHSLPEEYTDPLASKKPRISHLSGRTASDRKRFGPSEHAAHKNVTRATGDDGQRNPLDPRRLFDSLQSAACQQDAEVTERLKPTPCAQEEPEGPADPPQPDRPPPPLIVPDLDRHTIKRKKSKHKHKDQEKRRDRKERTDHSSKDPNKKKCGLESLACTDPEDMLLDSDVLQEDSNSVDYLSQYTVICNQEQRQSYKQDFNKEYNEYLDLHARIDSVTRQFMGLDTQLKKLHHESHKYKTVHNQILQEYRQIKKSNPNYTQEKNRCEYLHSKLAHIKKLISQYDQQQLGAERSSPN